MKPDLLILHGALGAPSQFTELRTLLSTQFSVHLVPFDGHGGHPIREPYSIELFAQNLRDYCTQHSIERPFVFGYSMGGYVALYAAHQGFPIARLMTLGTKFAWSPEGAAKEIGHLQPELIEEKVPKFAAYQAALHSPLDWKDVMSGTAAMMTRLGNQPVLNSLTLSQISLPTMCCLGSADNMVGFEETQWAVQHLSHAEIRICDGMQHPIERVSTSQLADEIRVWFLA